MVHDMYEMKQRWGKNEKRDTRNHCNSEASSIDSSQNASKDRQHAAKSPVANNEFGLNADGQVLHHHSEHHHYGYHSETRDASSKKVFRHDIHPLNLCPNWISYLFFLSAAILLSLILKYGSNSPRSLSDYFRGSNIPSGIECKYTLYPIASGKGNLCVYSTVFKYSTKHVKAHWKENEESDWPGRRVQDKTLDIVAEGDLIGNPVQMNTKIKNELKNLEELTNDSSTKDITLLVLLDLFSEDPLEFLVDKYTKWIEANLKGVNIELVTFDWRGSGSSPGHAAHLYPLESDLNQIWDMFHLDDKTVIVIAHGQAGLIAGSFQATFKKKIQNIIYLNTPFEIRSSFYDVNRKVTSLPIQILKKTWSIKFINSLLPYYPVFVVPASMIYPPEIGPRDDFKVNMKLLNIWTECQSNTLNLSQKALMLFSENDFLADHEKISNKLKDSGQIIIIQNYAFHNLVNHSPAMEIIFAWIKKQVLNADNYHVK